MDSAMQKLKDFTLEGMADKIECPILIVHGEHDTIVPVEIARAPPTAAAAQTSRGNTAIFIKH